MKGEHEDICKLRREAFGRSNADLWSRVRVERGIRKLRNRAVDHIGDRDDGGALFFGETCGEKRVDRLAALAHDDDEITRKDDRIPSSEFTGQLGMRRNFREGFNPITSGDGGVEARSAREKEHAVDPANGLVAEPNFIAKYLSFGPIEPTAKG